MNLFRSLHSFTAKFVLESLCAIVGLSLWALPSFASSDSQQSLCPQPALSQVTRHRVAAGETIDSIAQQYNLIPATLMGFNAALRDGSVPVGTEILIPPYNGIRVEVPAGSSWRDIAKSYGVRADVLFEINGCQEAPRIVFVPGVNWSPQPTRTATSANPLNRYPLAEVAMPLQNYGWQLDPATSRVIFNSGIDLEASAGTQVLATGAGTIAFVGEQSGSQMVVINHAQGLQTRYGLLAEVSVQTGQQVQAGDRIGTVGAGEDTSSRLHFEVRSNSNLGWVAQDPGDYIPELKRSDRGRR